MQLIGIVAGVSFLSWFLSLKKLLLWSGITFGLGQIVIALSSSLWVVVAGSVLAGFAYNSSVVLTTVFQLVSGIHLNQLHLLWWAVVRALFVRNCNWLTNSPNGMLVFNSLDWLIVISIFVMYLLQKASWFLVFLLILNKSKSIVDWVWNSTYDL